MATTTSGYPAREAAAGLLHHGPSLASSLSNMSCASSSLGFGIPTANGSEDHCNVALAGLFQQIMNDMKGSTFAWEDFLTKSSRLHAALKSTLVASSAFLDAFQRVADVATNARGASKEIGKCLTRMVLRQRSIEAKMKAFASTLMDCVVTPLQEKMEDWKKTCLFMDKEHAKEYKKCRQEIKKRSTDTVRLQKKAKKAGQGISKQGIYSTGTGSNKAMDAFNDLVEMKRQLQDKEYEAVRQAMIEERSRFCLFVSCLKPFLDEELGMLGEMVHLEELTDSLMQHSADPFQLPPASAQALLDIKATCSSSAEMLMQDHLSANDTYYSSSCSSGSNQWGNYRSPPSSPLPDDSASARSSKISNNQDDVVYRDRGEFSAHGQRHRSVCSSNASNSSYASSDVSSYGGHDLDKTLMSAPKTYRRCFSDNNGQSEQHYYPSSIASSIAEREAESEEDDSGNNDTLLPASHKGKPKTRRSSLSQSEDLARHHPLSLAIRNEYYSTIRFSSISSGDSGFISHPDHVNGHDNGGPSVELQQDGSDSLLTPTVNGSQWSPPASALSDGPAGTCRKAPAVPPFGSISHSSQERPHTIAHNGYPGLLGRPDSGTQQNMRNSKRPPLMHETFIPPQQNPDGQQSTVQPKDFRRTFHSVDGPPPPPRREETIYANSNLLSDTSALPPPPDNWMDNRPGSPGGPNSRFNHGNQNSEVPRFYQAHEPPSEMSVSMTIRRAKERKDDPRWNTQTIDSATLKQAVEVGQTEVVLRRRETMVDRSHRRLSQQIYGVPSNGLTNRPPPPPLPIRRTPSLHQSMQDADGDMPMGEVHYNVSSTPVRQITPPVKKEFIAQQGSNSARSHDHNSRPADNHSSMIQSLQERLRVGPRGNNNQFAAVPISAWTKAPSQKTTASPPANPPANGLSRMQGSFHPAAGDPRNGILSDIRSGAFALRKVSPDQCRDRSAPLVRK